MHQYRFFPMVVLYALVLPGCAAIFSGTSQEIAVHTTPSEAACKLVREGVTVGEIRNTPGTQTIKKTKHDLFIECEKAGYQKTTYLNDSGIDPWTYGDILGVYLGPIFWAIDSAAGADNKYTSPVNISMVPASPSGAPSRSLPRNGRLSFPPLSSRVDQTRRVSLPGPATYGVHFGSYKSTSVAKAGWTGIWNQHWQVLQGVRPYVEYSTVGGGAAGYNLYGKGLTKLQAEGLCRNILDRQGYCAVVYF